MLANTLRTACLTLTLAILPAAVTPTTAANPCEPAEEFSELRIVTYNVLNGLGPNGSAAWNSVGDMITTFDFDGDGPNTSLMPDIVCFQELDQQAVSDLVSFRNQFLPDYQARTASGDGFNYNAILFSPDITILAYTNLSVPGPRNLNKATFQIAGAEKTLTVYNAHFKCCGDSSSQNTRRSQADRVGEEIWLDKNVGLDLDGNGSRESPPGWVILAGDLNANTLTSETTLDGVFFYDIQNEPTGIVDLPVESLFGRTTASFLPNTFPGGGGSRLDYICLDEELAMIYDLNDDGVLSQSEINAMGFVYFSNDNTAEHAPGQFANGNVNATSFGSDHRPVVFDVLLPSTPTAPACPGDVNGSSGVDLADLSIVLSNFGTSPGIGGSGDADCDGVVDLADLSIVLSNFGCSSPE
jgi:endonuclease/exonuclease/phosphatase family metal-dependent hydrolase